jgi:predicted naringenin-chalcone synthase
MAFILGVSCAVPEAVYLQEDLAQKLMDILSIPPEKVESFQRLYAHSSIEKRYSVLADLQHARSEWKFWGPDYPKTIPGMEQRNQVYKTEAPKLAQKAVQSLLEAWTGDRSSITHLISVSCTGMIAPGIEFHLMQNLGLSNTINRLGINFMGCFGAFKGLSVAFAFAQANPEARILVVCTELCTLHMHACNDPDTMLANALFGDGAAAVLVGGNPKAHEKPLREIKRVHACGFRDSMDKMSWEAGDHGFRMRLCHTVPVAIKRHMKVFAQELLQHDAEIEQCEWAIHPGGTSILQAVEKSLQLDAEQTRSSWKILRDYGNMSSAAFLFVLHDLFESEVSGLHKSSNELEKRIWTAGVGFGPGLSMEGILLKKVESRFS